MIKIEMKPIKNEVEIPGYGVFFISPFGAGAEAEMNMAYRKMVELREDTKQYTKLAEDEKAGKKIDKTSAEYKKAIEAFNAVSKSAEELHDLTIEKLRSVITGDNVDKLFNDFTYTQLMDIYKQATRETEE